MKKYLLSLSVWLLPVIVSAQVLGGFNDIAGGIADIVRIITPMMIGLAFIYFVWGVVKYVISKDPEKQKEAKTTIFWGVIAMTVVIGIWSISFFLLGELGVDERTTNVIIPGVGGGI